jgi:hypothetical protein
MPQLLKGIKMIYILLIALSLLVLAFVLQIIALVTVLANWGDAASLSKGGFLATVSMLGLIPAWFLLLI